MEQEARALRCKVVELQKVVDSAQDELNVAQVELNTYESACVHEYRKPEYVPVDHTDHTKSGSGLPSFWTEEKWRRVCGKCGKQDYTSSSADGKPIFSEA